MASVTSFESVVTFEQARSLVEKHAAAVLTKRRESPAHKFPSTVPKKESLSLVAARRRILAEPILADRDFPPFPRATRDGYAVRAADVQQVPARLDVIGEIKAGDAPAIANAGTVLSPGQAMSIMTGAPLPSGADAVVMVEYTSATGNSVEVLSTVRSGENYVPRAAEARSGQVLVERGQRIDHGVVAIAAAVGKSSVKVFSKPRIAVLATGDEIVEIDTAPASSQIRNSNTYSLAAQIEEVGGEAVPLPIAPDEPNRLRDLVGQGFNADLLLITGGVSMGKYDLVEKVLAALNAEFYFTGARIQPGKPIVFGSCGPGSVGPGSCGADTPVRVSPNSAQHLAGQTLPQYFFGLPGNPVSTMVTFRLFVEPMIAALAGANPEPLIFPKARLKAEVKTKTGLTRFLPATLSGSFNNIEVELTSWQGSGDIAALARSNCYLVIPSDRERIKAGEWVSVLIP
jgi:molybdopterin molybdotransferase